MFTTGVCHGKPLKTIADATWGHPPAQFKCVLFDECIRKPIRMKLLLEALTLYLISPADSSWIAKCVSIGCSCMYARENYAYKSLIQVHALFLREASCGLNNLVITDDLSLPPPPPTSLFSPSFDSRAKKHILVDLPEEVNLMKMTNMDFSTLPDYSYNGSDKSQDFDVTTPGKYDNILALEMHDLELRLDNNSTLNFIRVFKGLAIIDLSNNRITRIKKNTFMNMSNLKVINLNNNMIISIEQDAFQDLSQLSVLQLSKNSLITVPSNIPPSLQVLTLAENRFGHFTINLHYPKLMILDLCGNFLSKSDLIILNDVKFLKRICLGDNGVGMPANLNVKAPYLANITLSALFQMHALLDNATVEELSQFLSLKDLTLIHFHINTLSFLANKTQLMNLRLEHLTWNGTETNVTEYFENKNSLNRISLDQSPTLANLLLFKTNAISILKNLTHLSLQFTGIKTLSPVSLPSLSKLHLDISFNALICDERLQWVVDARAVQPNFLLSEDNTICAAPEERKLVDELRVSNVTMATPTPSTTIGSPVTSSLGPAPSSRGTVRAPVFRTEFVDSRLAPEQRVSYQSEGRTGIIVMGAVVGVLSAAATALIFVYGLNRQAKTKFAPLTLRGYSQETTALVE
nr:PREDICTED: slit homolog 1 protein-like isoform X1 [Bemisia tabaci]